MKKIFFTTICFLIFLLGPVSFGNAKDEIIVAIHITGLRNLEEEKVRHVLPFQEGDKFVIEKMDEAVTTLRRWGIFDTIQVNIASTQKGKILSFHLDEATVVTLIDITGNYPFVQNRIRKYLSLQAGDIYTPQSVQEQVERIKSFYEEQGYIHTTIDIRETPRPENNGVDITFSIHRGEVLRYCAIEVSGTHVYPRGRVLSTINPYKPFSEKRLKAALRKLTDFYHEHGFPQARIEVLKKEINYNKNRVDLHLEVHEGPQIIVKFYGNRHISDRTLKKTVTFFREGSFDSYEIDASVVAIKKILAARGYPDANITAERTDLSEQKKLITFLFREGELQFLRRIRFPGRKEVSKTPLKKVLKNQERSLGTRGPFQPHLEERDTKALLDALKAEGYLHAKVYPWKIKKGDDLGELTLQIPINEGIQTKIENVFFTGNKNIPKKELLRILKLVPGKPFNEFLLDEEQQQLLLYYGDHGYPYADVKVTTSLDPQHHIATLTYDINERTEVHIGEILIVGDILTSQKAIKKVLGFKKGDLFSRRKLLEAELHIRRLGSFSSVNVETIGLQEGEETIHLVIKVEEQLPFLVDIDFGYSTDDQYTGKLSFTNLNAFGWAKHNSLKLTGGRDLSRAEVGWIDPSFLGTPFEMTTNTWIEYKEEPAFRSLQVAGANGWFRRFRRFDFLFRFKVERNYLLEGNVAAADAESVRNNTLLNTSGSVSYDSRDSFSDPRRGILGLLTGDLSNEIRGNEANFVTMGLFGEYNRSPFRRVTLASSARVHRIQQLGANVSVPLNKRLFLGGDDTIRGFLEDSLGPRDTVSGAATGGLVRWIVNEELRFRLLTRLNITFFYDIGQLTNTFTDLSLREARHSAGIGLRYITPVGPIRFDYGFKLDQEPGEDLSRFHFTFGYVF